MKSLRAIAFWCHLVTGVCAGVVVLVMAATGTALTYQKQLTTWADLRTADGSPPAATAVRLPPEALIRWLPARRDLPPLTAMQWRPERDAPVQLSFGRDRVVFVNAYTGAALGEGSPRVRAFFRDVIVWHRWLGGANERRELGGSITGACNLAFLFLVLSGVYLWWPRQWSRRALSQVTLFRRGLGPKARDFNWHNVIGFWSALPLLVVVLSGVVISYPWANDLAYRAVGEAPPSAGPRGGPPRATAAPRRTVTHQPPWVSLGGTEALVRRAERRVPGWRTLSLQVPFDSESPLRFTIDRGTGGEPHKRVTLELDRGTGETVLWEPFAAATRGRRLRMILRYAHTGEVLGVAGQTVAGLASAGATLLVWTGLSLAVRRLWGWRARRREERANLRG